MALNCKLCGRLGEEGVTEQVARDHGGCWAPGPAQPPGDVLSVPTPAPCSILGLLELRLSAPLVCDQISPLPTPSNGAVEVSLTPQPPCQRH